MTAITPNQREERLEALKDVSELILNNDLDTAIQQLAKVQVSPETLSLMKDWYGADWIRKHKFDTTLADEEFGHGWLDR